MHTVELLFSAYLVKITRCSLAHPHIHQVMLYMQAVQTTISKDTSVMMYVRTIIIFLARGYFGLKQLYIHPCCTACLQLGQSHRRIERFSCRPAVAQSFIPNAAVKNNSNAARQSQSLCRCPPKLSYSPARSCTQPRRSSIVKSLDRSNLSSQTRSWVIAVDRRSWLATWRVAAAKRRRARRRRP